MEIIINNTNLSEISTKTEQLELQNASILEQLIKLSYTPINIDGIVKYSDSEKNLSSL